MRTKVILTVLAVLSILALMVLLSRENVYVVLALAAGMLLLGYRELWSLIRYRRLPVIDERVRSNLTGAMRITGIFFFIESLILILLLHFNVFKDTPASLLIGGQLMLVGLMYLIGYNYYDRVEPCLGKKAMKFLKVCLITAGFSLGLIAFSITFHNLIYLWFELEEAVFFILGLLVAPAVLGLSLLGSLGVYVKGLAASFSGDGQA